MVVAAALAALSLLCAAVALAATPKPGTYEGKTQQKRPVLLEVGSDRNVARLAIVWKARNCENDPEASWGPDTTRFKSTIPVAEDGSFTRTKKYQRTDEHGFTGRFRAKIGGAFTKPKVASGTFDITVRVTKAGKAIDKCHQRVTWSVSG